MAVITQGVFKLEQCSDDSIFWDLSQQCQVKHKDGSVTTEYKSRGYGLTLSQCINKIILIITSCKVGNTGVTFKEYLAIYKSVADEVIAKFSIGNINSAELNNYAVCKQRGESTES